VLYPTGRAGSIWQISKAFGSSDVQVVVDLLDRVEASGCFDPNRISITGVSNGAGFAVRMACQLPARFAAVVAISAGYRALDACPGVRASFLAIHGSLTPSSRSTAARRTTRATCCATRPTGRAGMAARPRHPAPRRATP
jgi:poly(3-hydroxybutyrate) depolymerase